jgi:hypothetical protein
MIHVISNKKCLLRRINFQMHDKTLRLCPSAAPREG